MSTSTKKAPVPVPKSANSVNLSEILVTHIPSASEEWMALREERLIIDKD